MKYTNNITDFERTHIQKYFTCTEKNNAEAYC